jgi:Xaa-Pro dipeptidase
MKPGVHWDVVHLEAHKTLIRGFQRLGIFYSPTSPNSGSWNSEEAILASGISASFFPHGLGHSLGMDVHDVPSISKPAPPSPTIPPKTSPGETGPIELYHYLRLRLPLESGMVLTNEPGCYFSPHLMEAGKVRESKHVNVEVLEKYAGVGGVRIEDVVLITDNEDGYENLTKVGKSVEWLEGVCSGEI